MIKNNSRAIYKTLTSVMLAFLITILPAQSFAATNEITATFNDSSLTSSKERRTIFGTASGVKAVRIKIYKEGNSRTLYSSRVIKVKNDKWKVRVSKKLADGVYNIKIINADKKALIKEIATDTLTIGDAISNNDKSDTTLVVESVQLLSGGTARSGESVSMLYLQVINIGKEAISVKGFNVNQSGSAPSESIKTLEIYDDLDNQLGIAGGVEGKTPFKESSAFIPTNTAFAPGQMRLFTIKAVMSNNISSFFGKEIKIDVTSVDTNSSLKNRFPIIGKPWVIGY